MSKPTILILSIVYLISILIVGIFGMQIMSFNKVNYIESIRIAEEDIESNSTIDIFKEEEILDENGNISYWQYKIAVKYTENLKILIKRFNIIGKDPTSDPTDITLNVTADKNYIEYNNGEFTVKQKGTVNFTFASQDKSYKKMLIKIICY